MMDVAALRELREQAVAEEPRARALAQEYGERWRDVQGFIRQLDASIERAEASETRQATAARLSTLAAQARPLQTIGAALNHDEEDDGA